MKVVISLAREPSNPEKPGLRYVSAVAMSYLGPDGELVMKVCHTDDNEDEQAMWQGIASVLSRSDVIPYGWNMRTDIWPCICANMARLNVKCTKLQPLTERWAKASLGDISIILNQSAYSQEAVTEREGAEFLTGESLEFMDESVRFDNPEQMDCMFNQEHRVLHNLIRQYTECMYEQGK